MSGLSQAGGPAPSNACRAVLGLFLLLVVPFFGYLLRGNRADDAYITYRYASNLLHGHGMVFNVGERVLGTTAPLHVFVLAALSPLSSDLPRVANVLSYVCLALLATVLYALLERAGEPRAGLVAAVLVAVTPTSYLFAPLETVLVAALSWALILASRNGPWWAVGVLAALACLTRGDCALLVVVVLLAEWIVRRDLRRILAEAALSFAIAAPWLLYAWVMYGSPVPGTAAAKTGWQAHLGTFLGGAWPKVFSTMLADSPWLSGLVLALAVVGVVRIVRERALRGLAIVPVWMLAYTAAYTLLAISWPFSWYYYPLLVGVTVLAGLGVDAVLRWLRIAGSEFAGTLAPQHPSPQPCTTGDAQLGDPPRSSAVWVRPFRVTAAVVGVALAVVLLAVQVRTTLALSRSLPRAKWSGARDALNRSIAAWLRENTPAGASVAMAEVGAIAYYSEIRVIDQWGLVTPEVVPHVKRGDFEWAVEHFRPDYVLVNYRAKDAAPGPTQWLRREYQRYEHVQSFASADYPFVLDLYRRKR